MSRVKHARDLKPGDIIEHDSSPILSVIVTNDRSVRVDFKNDSGVYLEPLQAVRVLNDCDSCEHRVHEGDCVTDCPCRRGCSACAGHGVVGTAQGDRPCLICNPPIAEPDNMLVTDQNGNHVRYGDI